MEPNKQPVEKLVNREDGWLSVVRVWETIQGEGPFAGMPATFIRLAGCNLQCPLCDTDYTSIRNLAGPIEVHAIVAALRPKLIVLTGGEPLRQNIRPLIEFLWNRGYKIQIETNGTYYRTDIDPSLVTYVCSPKAPLIHHLLMPRLAALKYVVQAGNVDPLDGLPLNTLGGTCAVGRPNEKFRGEVYVQPLDEQDEILNRANMAAAVSSSLQHGYRLCLQMHKIAGLP